MSFKYYSTLLQPFSGRHKYRRRRIYSRWYCIYIVTNNLENKTNRLHNNHERTRQRSRFSALLHSFWGRCKNSFYAIANSIRGFGSWRCRRRHSRIYWCHGVGFRFSSALWTESFHSRRKRSSRIFHRPILFQTEGN